MNKPMNKRNGGAIRKKLILNTAIVLLIISAMAVTSILGMWFVKGKLVYLTEQSSPFQVRTLEFQAAIQETINDIVNVSLSKGEKAYRNNRAAFERSLSKAEDIRNILASISGSEKMVDAHNELNKQAKELFEITEERLKAEDDARAGSNAIALKLKDAADRLNELNGRISLMQRNRFGNFIASLSDAEGSISKIRELESLRIAVKDIHLDMLKMQASQDEKAASAAKDKLDAQIGKAIQHSFIKDSKRLKDELETVGKKAKDLSRIKPRISGISDDASTAAYDAINRDLNDRISAVILAIEQDISSLNKIYSSAAEKKDVISTEAGIANSILTDGSELINSSLSIERLTTKLFTITTREELDSIEQEIKKVSGRIDYIRQNLNRLLNKIHAKDEIEMFKNIETVVESAKLLLFKKDGIISKVRRQFVMREKASEITESVKQVVVDEAQKGRKKVAFAKGEQEGAVGKVNRMVQFSAALIVFMSITAVIFGLFSGIWVYKSITMPVNQLNDTLARTHAIIDNIVDGLLVTDREGRIIHANRTLLDMCNFKGSDIIGKKCGDVCGEEVVELVDRVLKNAEWTGEVFSKEIEHHAGKIWKAVATGIRREAQTHAKEEMGALVIVRDITLEKEIDRMKTDFISTVSHELRTPLTSVLGFAKIIKGDLQDYIIPKIVSDDKKTARKIQQTQENLDIIIMEGQRLTTLINDVLDLAKMEAGKIEWRMEPVSVSEIIKRATSSTSSLFEQKGLKLTMDVDMELPEITGDGDRLIQVLINLISNAVKFTDEGAITVGAKRTKHPSPSSSPLRGEEIKEASFFPTGEVIKEIPSPQRGEGKGEGGFPDEIVISVTDSGIGITKEDQPKVFEKFKQVGDTLTDKPKGTGLGLPICKEIVEHHNGRLWVESEIGKGSTFLFTLPVLQTDIKTETMDMDTLIHKLKDHVVASSQFSAGDKKTILIVDDDAHIRRFLRQELETAGYAVMEAADGMEAISMLKNNEHPNLIILDVMMPEVSGFDVAAVVKNDPLTMNIPIIILSIVEEKERGFRLGVDRYLNKPVDMEALLNDIGALISQVESKKKVMVVDEDESAVKTMTDVLEAKGYSVVGSCNGTDCIEKAVLERPNMIIIDAAFSERHDIVKTLRFEKGLENIYFVFVANKKEGA